MTSEATAKLISCSGLAATELTPFAASAAIGDPASLRARIASLERVPALAEFARAALDAIGTKAGPAGAEHAGRCLENLQAAATAILRHLHCSESLQSIGSEYAVWVRVPTGPSFADFADRLTRIQRALDALASLAQTGARTTLEAADTAPLWIKVGLGSHLAREATSAALLSARSNAEHPANGRAMSEVAAPDAARIAADYFRRGSNPKVAGSLAEAIAQLARLIGEGVEIRASL